MKDRKIWKKLVGSIAAVCLLLCTGCGSVTVSGNDSILLKMGAVKLTSSEAKLVAMTNKSKFENYYVPLTGKSFWQTELQDGKTFETYVKDNTIWQELVSVTALNAIGEEKKIELTKEEEQKVKDAAEAYYAVLTKEEKKYTKAGKSSIENLMEKYVLSEKVIEELKRNTDMESSDNETRVMDIQVIFVTDQAKAEEAKTQTAAGMDFLQAAQTYGENSEYEYSVARGEMNASLEQAVFALESGQITDIVQTEKGFYIAKCVNSYNEERSQSNRKTLQNKKIYGIWLNEIESFAASHTLLVNEKAWDKLSLAYAENVKNNTLFETIEQYFPQET